MYKLQWRQNLHKLTATTLYMNSTERLPWSFQCHFCPSQHAMLWGLMCPKRQCITGWDENFVTSTTNYGTLLILIKTLNGPEMSFAVTTDQPKNEPKIILWEKKLHLRQNLSNRLHQTVLTKSWHQAMMMMITTYKFTEACPVPHLLRKDQKLLPKTAHQLLYKSVQSSTRYSLDRPCLVLHLHW